MEHIFLWIQVSNTKRRIKCPSKLWWRMSDMLWSYDTSFSIPCGCHNPGALQSQVSSNLVQLLSRAVFMPLFCIHIQLCHRQACGQYQDTMFCVTWGSALPFLGGFLLPPIWALSFPNAEAPLPSPWSALHRGGTIQQGKIIVVDQEQLQAQSERKLLIFLWKKTPEHQRILIVFK